MTPAPAPRSSRDPYAAGFVAALVIVFVIGIVLAVRALLSLESGPPAQPPTGGAFTAMLARLNAASVDVATRLRATLDRNTPAQTGAGPKGPTPATTNPQRAYPALAESQIPALPHVSPVPANGAWTYDVSFGPQWNKAGQLLYQTMPQAQGQVGANMSWVPSGAQPTTWFLGIVAANHPSHANTRFPGFFMHPAYLPGQLQPGLKLKWEFPWQGSTASGRVRRYEMAVTGWERVKVPAGEFAAARLDGTLRYIDGGAARAEVRYRLWYAPRAKQVVRLVWMGRAPDEGGTEMIAELAAQRTQ